MKKILLVCAIMVAALSFTGCGVTSHVSQNRDPGCFVRE